MQTMTISPAEELLWSPRRVVAEAVRGGDDEAVVDEAPAAPALLRANLDPRHPRTHVDGVISLHYPKIIDQVSEVVPFYSDSGSFMMFKTFIACILLSIHYRGRQRNASQEIEGN